MWRKRGVTIPYIAEFLDRDRSTVSRQAKNSTKKRQAVGRPRALTNQQVAQLLSTRDRLVRKADCRLDVTFIHACPHGGRAMHPCAPVPLPMCLHIVHEFLVAHMSCTPCVPSCDISKLYKYGREVIAIFRFVVQFYRTRTEPVQSPYRARTVPVHSAR